MGKIFGLLCCCITPHLILGAPVTCSQEPVAACSPLHSILHTWPKKYFEYSGERLRLSTCTGVMWVNDRTLLSVDVYHASLDTYQFDPCRSSLIASNYVDLKDLQQSRLGQLENIVSSRDGSFAAITNNGDTAVHLYKVVGSELMHFARIPNQGGWNHGVRFSPGMDYLAYTVFDKPGKIRLFRISKDAREELRWELAQVMDVGLFPLQPKSLDFSLDCRFVAVCYGINNSKKPASLSGALAVYRFDKVQGVIDPIPVSCIDTAEGLCIPEDLCFSRDGSCILVSNHGNDTVTVHSFDQATGKISQSEVLLGNPKAQLSFPHGLCISPDGQFLAVTNYGDDTVKIYTLSATLD